MALKMAAGPPIAESLTWLGQKIIPRWLVYATGGVLVALGLAVPWLATRAGLLRYEAVEHEPVGLRPELLELPGGTFTMGSPPDEVGRQDDEVAHQVTVSPFAICLTEVTQGQWEAVMGDNPSDCRFGCGPDLPVQNVSWVDAVRFLNTSSEREGLPVCYEIEGDNVNWPDRNCQGYRLPTEAEWEYAARAGTSSRFSFGDDESGLDVYAWYSANSGGRVHRVGSKEPNHWGLRDVHGNVWEWVWDRYGASPVNLVEYPLGPSEGQYRVLRGGSFGFRSWVLRSALRDWLRPTSRDRDFGFRCARSLRPQQ